MTTFFDALAFSSFILSFILLIDDSDTIIILTVRPSRADLGVCLPIQLCVFLRLLPYPFVQSLKFFPNSIFGVFTIHFYVFFIKNTSCCDLYRLFLIKNKTVLIILHCLSNLSVLLCSLGSVPAASLPFPLRKSAPPLSIS